MNGLMTETGNRFGRLTVIKRAGSLRKKAVWLCRCDCGNKAKILGGNLRSGRTTSCGCFQIEASRRLHTTHGMTAYGEVHPAYNSYAAAKARCEQLGHKARNNYGGRGIQFKLPPFTEFWKVMRGTWKPGLTLDREDNNGHYEMGNVRWATRQQQADNTRRLRVYSLRGREVTVKDLAKMADVSCRTMNQRLRRALSVEDAVALPHRYANQATFGKAAGR